MIKAIAFTLMILLIVIGLQNAQEISGFDRCGDCEVPTLGLDEEARRIIDGGLTINGFIIDVGNYFQDTETQISDGSFEIILRVYENSGIDSIKHVGMYIGVKEVGKLDSAESYILLDRVTNSQETIDYTKNTIQIKSVELEPIDPFTMKVTIKFFLETEGKKTIATSLWDEKRNVQNNYFIDAIEVVKGTTSEVNAQLSGDSNTIIPNWVKTNAKWWSEGTIDDNSFIQAIQYLIKEAIMKIPQTQQGTSSGSYEIPSWIKNNAALWAAGQIDDESFIQGIQFMIKEGIMKI